jgi:hypothetical protein
VSEFAGEPVGRVVQAVLLGEWDTQLRHGHLTTPGLRAVRGRLADVTLPEGTPGRSGEFEDGPVLRGLLSRVEAALGLGEQDFPPEV